MMNRRKFFSLLPAAPVAIVSWPADAAPKEDAPHVNEHTFVLCGSKEELVEKHVMGITPIQFRQNDPMKQVSMAVGQDGHLWIKPKDGVWKRVVTE